MSVQDISNDKNYLQNSVADPDFQRRGWWGGGGGGGGPPPPPPPPSCPSPGSATEIIYNPVKLREF